MVSSQITTSQHVAGSLTLTVASGQPIRVQTILLTTGTAAAQIQFTVTDNDDTTLFEVALLTDTSFILNVDAVFSNGLKVVSDTAAASTAVFHTAPGN